jgi:glutathione S-transferase
MRIPGMPFCAIIRLQVLNPGCRVAIYEIVGLDSLDEWPNVKRWVEKLAALPSVKTGSAIP